MNTDEKVEKKDNTEQLEEKKEIVDELEENTSYVDDYYGEIEDGKEEKKSILGNDRKKLIMIMAIILGLFLVFMLLLYVASSLSKRTYTYEEVETIMRDAARGYFTEHPESLPQTEGGAVEINIVNLIATGRMKELSEYFNSNVSCTGNVVVENIQSRYIAFPNLNCGQYYSSVELSKKIIENGTVTSGYGLYNINDTYVYRGELVKNFVKLGNSVWRVVKITPNNRIMLVMKTVLKESPWDNRYNTNLKENMGINQYSNSRVKESLDAITFIDEIYNKMVPFNMCIGKRSTTSTSKDNSEECKDVIKDQMVGLLTVSDYMLASIDSNCKSILSMSCQNYNYLNGGVDTWLATSDKDSSYKSYSISSEGPIVLKNSNETGYVRPVIYLNSRTLFKSGTGTIDDPYLIK